MISVCSEPPAETSLLKLLTGRVSHHKTEGALAAKTPKRRLETSARYLTSATDLLPVRPGTSGPSAAISTLEYFWERELLRLLLADGPDLPIINNAAWCSPWTRSSLPWYRLTLLCWLRDCSVPLACLPRNCPGGGGTAGRREFEVIPQEGSFISRLLLLVYLHVFLHQSQLGLIGHSSSVNPENRKHAVTG